MILHGVDFVGKRLRYGDDNHVYNRFLWVLGSSAAGKLLLAL